jgi:hypothetical protein
VAFEGHWGFVKKRMVEKWTLIQGWNTFSPIQDITNVKNRTIIDRTTKVQIAPDGKKAVSCIIIWMGV